MAEKEYNGCNLELAHYECGHSFHSSQEQTLWCLQLPRLPVHSVIWVKQLTFHQGRVEVAWVYSFWWCSPACQHCLLQGRVESPDWTPPSTPHQMTTAWWVMNVRGGYLNFKHTENANIYWDNRIIITAWWDLTLILVYSMLTIIIEYLDLQHQFFHYKFGLLDLLVPSTSLGAGLCG